MSDKSHVDVQHPYKVLWLVNHYHNEVEVNHFLKQVDDLGKRTQMIIDAFVCDNSGGFALQTGFDSIAVQIISPPHNLGYLGGCAYAFKAWMKKDSLPDFVAISNTDLHLPTNLELLFKDVPNDVGLCSPIVQDKHGHQQNPHLRQRLPSKVLQRYIQIFKFPPIGSLYLLLNQLKRNVQISSRYRPSTASPLASGRIDLYAAHGSIFFLTKKFFEQGGSLDHWHLLYGEELYIAEQLRASRLRAVCDSSVTVIHEAHSTTKLLSLYSKSKHFYQGYKAIYERYISKNLIEAQR
jgi:GT2 family glycosyltransferase